MVEVVVAGDAGGLIGVVVGVVDGVFGEVIGGLANGGCVGKLGEPAVGGSADNVPPGASSPVPSASARNAAKPSAAALTPTATSTPEPTWSAASIGASPPASCADKDAAVSISAAAVKVANLIANLQTIHTGRVISGPN